MFGGGLRCRKITIGCFQVHLNRSDGLTILGTDEELCGQVITDVFFMRNLNNILFGFVFFVIEFRPIFDGEDVVVPDELLLGECS